MFKVQRCDKNPILAPTNRSWENKAVFNCAVIDCKEDGIIRILYRAIGDDNISRIGLAESVDGIHITDRYPEPIISPENELEKLGIEDPRITKIGDTYYITYVAASHYPDDISDTHWRVRTCCMTTKDFVKFDKIGCLLPDIDNKDVVLFPEKINGKYYMLHRIMPDIWIAESDDLLNWTNHRILFSPGPKGSWDCNRIGAGAPPIRTEQGWLNFYHGVDDNMVYSVGTFLLKIDDPMVILERDAEPMLTPEEHYEREGLVPNVVFTCGVLRKDPTTYYIYYGGADKVIGLAIASIF